MSGMPSNVGIKRAPFLVLGNFMRNLRLQKGKKGGLLGGRDVKGTSLDLLVPGSLGLVGSHPQGDSRRSVSLVFDCKKIRLKV